MHAGMNPAIGPAMPMSKSAARDGIGPLMRMKAPSVPIRLGNGTKYGSVRIRDSGGRKGSVHLVRQQNKHQRQGEWKARQQLDGMHNRLNGNSGGLSSLSQKIGFDVQIELIRGFPPPWWLMKVASSSTMWIQSRRRGGWMIQTSCGCIGSDAAGNEKVGSDIRSRGLLIRYTKHEKCGLVHPRGFIQKRFAGRGAGATLVNRL